ncbi:MAG: hypothetical protein JSW51_11285 [Gemmatimonadota bacterium]|nr:MAG: hypothetical protein JSW51_11285 [Gemmatimonadota bacterium]
MRLSYRLSSLSAMAAPARLRWRILAALDAEDRAAPLALRGRRHPALWATALAAATLVLLLARVPDSADSDATNAIASLADQAVLDLGGTGSLESSDPAELGSWLATQMGYHVDIPSIEHAVLLGGRVTKLNEAPSVAVLYRMGGERLTYFALPADNGLGSNIPTNGVRSASTAGLNMAMWYEAGGARVIVSAMDEKDVVAVARECKRTAAGS